MFVGEDEYPSASFPEKYISQNQQKMNLRTTIFNVKRENFVYDEYFGQDGYIWKKFNRYELPKKAEYSQMVKATPNAFALGIGAYDKQINWGSQTNGYNLPISPHALIEGSKDSGIEQLLKNIEQQAKNEGFEIRVLDNKKETTSTLTAKLQEIEDLIKSRYAKMGEKRVNEWKTYTGIDHKTIVILKNLEQLEGLKENEHIKHLLQEITRLGRAAAIHVIISGSDTTALNGETRANCGIRILCGKDPANKHNVFGTGQYIKNASQGVGQLRVYGDDVQAFRIFGA